MGRARGWTGICAVLALAVGAAALVPAAARADIVGKPWVVDGDTIEIAGRRIALFGIDAPDTDQTCQLDGREWNCGRDAMFALANLIGHHWVVCKGETVDDDGRLLAVCYLGAWDINGRMVRDGWALARRDLAQDYVGAEIEAKRNGAGLWRSRFQPPWEWAASNLIQ
ncbi:MAG: thermonuclease family protein [Hyphomicrobiales bacterium]|nr:thermonuclease family protein [Hyphomicrobiales bacterium]